MRLLFGVLALLSIMAGTAGHARAADYYSVYTGLGGGTYYSETPFGLCGSLAADDGELQANPGPYTRVCEIRRHGTTNVWAVVYYRVTSSGNISGVSNVSTLAGGNTCFNSFYATAPGNSGAGATTYGVGDVPCSPCPDGQEWNASTLVCEAPECDEDETYDESISACRPVCDETDVFHYSSMSCKPQCPVGKAYERTPLSNGKIPLGLLAVPTVNGCKVDYNFWCVEDTKAPAPDGPPQGYFRDDEYTGKICLNWWTYTETLPTTIEAQIIFEEESEAAGFYDPSSTAVADDVKGYDTEAVTVEDDTAPMSEPADVTAVHVLCSGGEKRIAITVNGVLEEAIFLGPCSQPNEEYEPSGPIGPESEHFALMAKMTELASEEEEQTGVLGEVRDALTGIAEKVEGIYDSLTGEGEGCEGSDCVIDGGSLPSEADPEGAYTRRHAEGAEGVSDLLDGATLAGDSDLQEFMTDIQPIWPSTVPACLSWDIDIVFWGETHFEPPCWLWDMLAIFLKLFAVVCAWGLLFGARSREA